MAAAAAGKAVTEDTVVAAMGAGPKATGARKAAAARELREVAIGMAIMEVVALAAAAAGTKLAVVRVTGKVGVEPTVTMAKGSARVARGRRERSAGA